MNDPATFNAEQRDRVRVLAAYLRSQVALAARPPVGCVELNNEEAALCADILESFNGEWKPRPDLRDRFVSEMKPRPGEP